MTVTVDAANGWGSDNVDRTIGDNVELNENYYEKNQSLSGGDITLSHGAPNKGDPNTTVNNHNKSNDTFEGKKMNYMSIDDATVKDAVKDLTNILSNMKDGDKKTPN